MYARNSSQWPDLLLECHIKYDILSRNLGHWLELQDKLFSNSFMSTEQTVQALYQLNNLSHDSDH